MGNLRATVPIILSVVIALTGSFLLYQWIQKQKAPAEVVTVESEAVTVSVAAVDIPWGTKLTPEMIKTASFLKESVPQGHFASPEMLDGRVTIASLKLGEPVLEHRLAPDSIETGGVSAILPQGKRAVAVKGDKVIGISGFINPGNRVDVLVTLRDPRTDKDKTKMVLASVPVLATGTQVIDNGNGKPAPVDVYTLEVTPEEGEKLTLASTQGRLQFALRNLTDAEKVLTPGATISQTLASLSWPEPKRRRVLNTTRTIEVIKGNDVSKKKLRL